VLCAALFAASGASAAPVPESHYVVLQAGQLLGVPGHPPVRNQTLVIQGEHIVEVRDGFVGAEAVRATDATVEVIDLRDHFVLPGLLDAHTHLMWSPRDTPPKKADKMTDSDLTLWTLRNARTTLGAGFTTVRELASSPLVTFAVRDWINAGKFIGPRILAAGTPIGALGGHGDRTKSGSGPSDVSASGLCSGTESCRSAVRAQHKLGSDLIKMMGTGGFSDSTGTEQFFFFDEMQATVEAAHQLGMPVTVHAYAANAVADAVRAGVDSVEHGFGATDETLKLMKQKGIFLVPTILVAEQTSGAAKDYREKYRAFERAVKIGTPIAFGTDSGSVPHAYTAREFAMMVKFGMTPAAAIEAATVNAARLFRLDREIGTLQAGKRADIVAVKGNPLEDVTVLERIDFVMKSGRIAKRDGRLSDMVVE
jgi:imidazolonepropionase-like amidohydrolase